LLGLALAACHSTAAVAPASPAPAAPANQITALPAGPATAVVQLAPGVPTAVLAGPFEVISVNPGGDLELAVAPTASCADPQLAWFGYSGGGVAAGTGQVLCARSSGKQIRTQAFSGLSWIDQCRSAAKQGSTSPHSEGPPCEGHDGRAP
jgi:hypothetical protein